MVVGPPTAVSICVVAARIYAEETKAVSARPPTCYALSRRSSGRWLGSM